MSSAKNSFKGYFQGLPVLEIQNQLQIIFIKKTSFWKRMIPGIRDGNTIEGCESRPPNYYSAVNHCSLSHNNENNTILK